MSINADDVFSVLAHPMRLRAAILLYQHGELCVCELMHVLDLQQPIVSRHLAQLKSVGLLESRKQGQWVYYRISQTLPDWINQLIETTSNGVSRKMPYRNDIKNLKSMNDRPSQACC